MTNTLNTPSHLTSTVTYALNHAREAANNLDPLAALASYWVAARNIEEQMALAVQAARAQGETWQSIADQMYVTKQAAQQRYGKDGA